MRRHTRHATTPHDGPGPVDSRFSVLNRWKLRPLCAPHAIAGGFSGAFVFRIECGEGLFAMRGWPVGADQRRLNSLHLILVHVAESGVPVAVPLRGVDGLRLQWHAERWWQIEPWLSGEANYRSSPTRAKLNAAMTALAGFHAAASTFEGVEKHDEWFGGRTFGVAPSVRDRRQLVEQRLLNDGTTALRHRISRSDAGSFIDLAEKVLFHVDLLKDTIYRELRRGESLEVPLLPVLRDVWHDHVLFTGDRVTGLIDPAACRRDTVATDLSRLLGSFCGDDREQWQDAITSYARHRPLDENELNLIPILDRSGVLLSATNWLRRHYVDNVDCNTPAVVARIHELVERLERMH